MWLFLINKPSLLISFYKFFNDIYFIHFILLLGQMGSYPKWRESGYQRRTPHSIIIHSSTTTLPTGTDITLSKMLHLCDPICRQRVLTVSYVGILDHLILVILEKAKESLCNYVNLGSSYHVQNIFNSKKILISFTSLTKYV